MSAAANNDSRQKDLERTKAAALGQFKECVAEFSAFYLALIRRQSCQNEAFVALPEWPQLTAWNPSSAIEDESLPPEVHTALCRQMSICQSWMYLGDLARYREVHSDRAEKDWSSARQM